MSIKDLDPTSPPSDGLAGLGDNELRDLKTALQACWPEVDGLISNQHATGGAGDTNPPDAATFSNLFDKVALLYGIVGGASYMPIGGIIMWSGSVASIPAGFALCDGGAANGQQTPDLRGRFIVGVSDPNDTGFNPGNNGGNEWQSYGSNAYMVTQPDGEGTADGVGTIPDHVIKSTDLPEHEHFMFAAGAGTNTTHPGTGFAGVTAQSHPSSDDRRYVLSESGASSANQGKSGQIIGGGVDGDLTLTHGTISVQVDNVEHKHEYTPRFYALAYIMRVGEA